MRPDPAEDRPLNCRWCSDVVATEPIELPAVPQTDRDSETELFSAITKLPPEERCDLMDLFTFGLPCVRSYNFARNPAANANLDHQDCYLPAQRCSMSPFRRVSTATRIIPEPDTSSAQKLFPIALMGLEEGRSQGYEARCPPGREERGREV